MENFKDQIKLFKKIVIEEEQALLEKETKLLNDRIAYLEQREKDMLAYIDKGSELRFIHYLHKKGLVNLKGPLDIKGEFMSWLSQMVPENSVTDEVIYTFLDLKKAYDELKATLDNNGN